MFIRRYIVEPSVMLIPVKFRASSTCWNVKFFPCSNLLYCLSKATAPETCGVAMLVPCREENLEDCPNGPEFGTVDVIPTPGAKITMNGALFENEAIPSESVDAPTAVTFDAHAGAEIVDDDAEFPAAIATKIPRLAAEFADDISAPWSSQFAS